MNPEDNQSWNPIVTFAKNMRDAFKSVRSIRRENMKGWQTGRITATKSGGTGFTFGTQGLMLTEERIGEDGEKHLVVKGLRPSRRKGVSANSLVGGDPMFIYKPGAGNNVEPSKAMQNYTGLNYSMTRAIQDEMAAIEWQVFQIKADNNHEEVFEHELLDLLDGVNEYMTGPELRHVIAGQLELAGNACLLLLNKKGEPVSSATEKPKQMHPLDPGMVKVALDKTTFPYKIDGYTFRIENREYKYEPYQILHVKYPDPSNPYWGIGTTQALASWIDVDNYAMEFNRQYFLHGSYLTGTFETEMTGEDQLEELKEIWDEQHAGVQNSNKVAFLPKGVKFKEGVSIKDMSFDKLLAVTEGRILAGSRVGRTILGTAEADTTRSTAETADYVFAKRTIKPKLLLITSYINEFLTPRFGDDLYVTFKDPTPEDKSFRITEMKESVGGQPVSSINEARERYLGLGPVTGGDVVKTLGTMVDVGIPEDPNPEKPKKGLKVDSSQYAFIPSRTRFSQNAKVRKDAAESIAALAIKAWQEIKAKKIWKLSFDEYGVVEKKARERLEPYHKEIVSAVRKLNAEQQKEVLANLPGILEKAVNPADIFDIKKWTSVLVDFTTPTLTQLSKVEGSLAAEDVIGAGIDVTANAAYMKALKDGIDLMSRSYNQTTLDALKTSIQDGISAGAGIPKISQTVQDIYAFQDTTAADRVARTETFRTQNAATKQAWQDTGVVKSMKWYTSKLANVCPYCQAMDGKVVSIDQNFFNQGDSFSVGNSSLDLSYSDVGAPPLHPNCGCYIQPEDVSID